MKTLIIGANGNIGRRLVDKLVQTGHEVRAMVRSDKQRQALEEMGAEVVLGDLEAEFEPALNNCDALVFTAGSGSKTGADKTILIDMWGAIKTIKACEEAGVKRYIMVSSRDAGDPDHGSPAIRHYNVAKHIADDYLVHSTLDYTILRPGQLTDLAGTGLVQTVRPAQEMQTITRDDIAEAIMICLDEKSTIGKIVELYQGNTPVKDALLAH